MTTKLKFKKIRHILKKKKEIKLRLQLKTIPEFQIYFIYFKKYFSKNIFLYFLAFDDLEKLMKFYYS